MFGSQFTGADYAFHFEKAKNDCENLGETCEIYTPLFHWLASAFAFHEKAFFFFGLVLLAFVTPMLLFYLSNKNWLAVWLYFSTTSYFWFFYNGLFSQHLATIFLLLVLLTKDWRIQLGLLVLSPLVHSHAFVLVLIAIIVKHIWSILKDKFVEKNVWRKLFPGCSGVFGKDPPEILTQPIGSLTSTGGTFNISHVLIFVVKIFPLPYFVIASYQYFKEKENFHLFILAIIFVIQGFLLSHRIFYLVPMMLIPGLTWWASGLSPRNKKIFLLSTLLVFGFQFFSWLQFKLVCSV